MRSWLHATAALLVFAGSRPASASSEPFVACIAFEDSEGGDFDFNDFAMRATVAETVDRGGDLTRVELSFESLCRRGGDALDVHIARSFAPSTRWLATIRRNRPSVGTETPETIAPTLGAGDLDVLLFDSAAAAPGDTVSIVVQVIRSGEVPVDGPKVFEETYDPWIFDRDTETERHVGDHQAFQTTAGVVPFVLVMPVGEWKPVGEYRTIIDDYPDFARWFATRDARFARWFEVDAATPESR